MRNRLGIAKSVVDHDIGKGNTHGEAWLDCAVTKEETVLNAYALMHSISISLTTEAKIVSGLFAISGEGVGGKIVHGGMGNEGIEYFCSMFAEVTLAHNVGFLGE